MTKINLIQSHVIQNSDWMHYSFKSRDELKFLALKQTLPIMLGWLAWAFLALYLMNNN